MFYLGYESFLIRERKKERKKGEKRWRKSGGYWQRCNGRKRLVDAAVPERAMTSFGRLVRSRCLANVKMQSVRVVKKEKKKGEKHTRKALSCRELIDVH